MNEDLERDLNPQLDVGLDKTMKDKGLERYMPSLQMKNDESRLKIPRSSLKTPTNFKNAELLPIQHKTNPR